MKRIILSLMLTLGFVAGHVCAQRADYRIIPQPKSVQTDTTQVFTLQNGMAIAYDATDAETARNAQFLQQWVEQATGVKLTLAPNDKRAAIRLAIGLTADKQAKKAKKSKSPETLSEQQQEAYAITVDKSGILVQARKPIGFFRAAQTLR